MKIQNKLLFRKEFYRIWFEFYKLALSHPDFEVRKSCELSTNFYALWGDVRSVHFDDWYPVRRHLFEEHKRARIYDGERKWGESVVVEIPLNRSTTELLRDVKTLIDDVRSREGGGAVKTKRRNESRFVPSEGSEPKLRALAQTLVVYQVFNDDRTLRGQRFLDAVRAHYALRKTEKGRKALSSGLQSLSHSGDGDADADAKRNLLRHKARAEKIIRNVAQGVFPGKY